MTTTQFLPFCANIANRLNNLKWLQASLNKLIVIGLLYSLLGIGTALAMSPAPSPGIPKLDPIPGTPNLSIDLVQTDIALRWNATEYAQFYTVHVYSGGQWQEVEDLYSTEATYDYERSGWDLSALQFKITACKVKPSWLSLVWWEGDRCSVDSNIVQLPQVNPAFSLSAYAVSLSTLSDSPVDSVDSQLLPADTVNAVRTIMATLRLRDAISWATQDIPWPIQIDEENFTVTSGKTILVKPGNYHIEFLATQGNVHYVARALNVALNGAQSSIPLQLKTVLGDGALTIDTLNDLSVFDFQPSSEQLTGLSQPAIGVKIDDIPETLLTFNPQLGITPQYHLISSGSHQIQLKIHDASLLKGRSQPQQENRWIVAGQNLTMNLIPLVGGVTTTLADADGTATLNFLIPSVVVDEVGGDPNNLQVILSLSGINNQPEDVLVDNLIYNATADAYQAQYAYSGLQADNQVAVSLTFSDISGMVNQLLGHCVANNLILDSVTRNIPCQLSLHRRITGGSHLIAELVINVLDTGNATVSGASIYAKRRGAQANPGEEELGTLLGVTGSGVLGTAGYLKTYLVPGSYQLTAHYRPTYSTAQEVINLEAFEVKNQNLILSRAPSISITAPAANTTVDSSYTISWTASDTDSQATISLYYDTNNSGYDGTLITSSLFEGIHNSYTWNTSSLSSGNYHIYAKINDGVNTPVYDYGAGRITVNRVPSINITAPAVDTTVDGAYTISWTASDPDNQATISLYYDTNNSGYDGTLITGSLVEGTDTSYNWNTSSLPSGNYYIYAKINDGVNTPVYDYGAGRITVNRVPSINITAPAVDTAVDGAYTISWTASDPDNQATISLYYDTNNSGYDGTLITHSLSEGIHSSYRWNTSSLPSGNYYIYAKINDGVNPPAYDYGAGRITVNRVPSINITAPAVDTTVDGAYTISWTASDPDNQATISLYYDTNNSGYDGTLITGSLVEGTDTSYNWNTSSLPSGNYYIYAKIDDGVNTPVYDYGTGRITVNRVPSINITAPAVDTAVDGAYTISWTASDPDNQATISLYYDTNNSGYDGTLITHSLSEGIHSSYRWNTSSLPSGNYYIYAKINDGVNPPAYDYGAGRITVNRVPSINITAPAANTTVDGGYTISWTASDPDNQATISLYYDTNNSGYDGTLITGSLSEGIHSSYRWNTSSLPRGSYYYIYAKIDDGVNTPVYDYGAGKVSLNRAPSITFTAPVTDMTASAHHKITWVADTLYNHANISLYYDANNSGYDGTLITDSLSEGIHNSYVWNTLSLTSGDYYIYTKIDDGVNPPVYRYANGKVTVVQTKLNDTGIHWGGNYPAFNNIGCTGETIAQQDCSHGRDAQGAAGTLTKVGGGFAGFDFTRLNADGSNYAGSGDYSSQPWACVRDNHTGLIWEVKTDDGSIHDRDNTYRWGGKTALVNQQARDDGWGDFYNDWDTLVDGSNSESLCGKSDWRVPSLKELTTISQTGLPKPSIDRNYFPNTRLNWYWSSSPYARSSSSAWAIEFSLGHDNYSNHGLRYSNYAVRLVRGKQ